ncbi:DUF4190 domain-containing protein [Flexivirga caeni]|uniref:DUF4190 domain-containing protein n=1 Tax=Flexivirga caeni TaxID=2294115 RepID=UPI0015E8797C|nr:DUF4190 domain-containing protein [Flexivirga caeni]
MSNYPNDPNQPGGNGEQPNDGSGYPQYGQPQYGNPPQEGQQPGGPQYGAPHDGSQYGAQSYGAPQYGAQPYGAPQYGAPQPGSPYGGVMPQEHQRGTLILVLGILSLVCCGLFTGIPAIIMGRQAMQEIDASGGAIGGRGKVKAGFICGIIGTAWTVVVVIIRLAAH